MVVCPSCGSSNPEGYRYCGQCGSDLSSIHCASCSALNPVGQRFCGQCGRPLAEPDEWQNENGPLEGGRRPGRGEAEASPQYPGERKLVTIMFADVVGFTPLAERTDAEVVARMVDSAFGELSRIVTEHGGRVDKYMGDSLMAVFGAPTSHDDDAERAIAAAIAIRDLGGELVFSIGINSGEVMATALREGDETVIGDTVNVAARLEKAAGAGKILCGRLTADLARRRVNFLERESVLLKGKSEPVDVLEVVSLRHGGHSGIAEETALVGRAVELEFLCGIWRRCREERRAQVVVVSGDAGVGKTRLIDALAGVVEEHESLVRSAYPGYGVAGGRRVAADLFKQFGPSNDPEVDRRVRSAAGDPGALSGFMEPDVAMREQVWAFGRMLKEEARTSPLMLIIDDMHHADFRTLELLQELNRRLGEVPMLVMLAGRREPGEWLSYFPGCTSLHLAPLGTCDSLELAQAFVEGKPLSSETAEFVVELSAGNPLYLRELIRVARDTGILIEHDKEYDISGRSAIPATLQTLLAAKLDALDPAAKQALQHVAVLGEATKAQIAAIAGDDADSVVDSLVLVGLLGRGESGRYKVVDSLLREVAYEMLPRHRRGDLHRRVASISESVEDRARHLARAAKYLEDEEAVAEEASEALVSAAEESLRSSRHFEAIADLRKAVELGERRPSVLIELARLEGINGDLEEAMATLELVKDDPEDPSVSVERDHCRAACKMFTEPAWACEQLDDIAERWRRLGNVHKEAWARANGGVARFNVSQVSEALPRLERALELFESVGDRKGAVATSSFLSLVAPTDTRVPRWLADALALAEESGDRSLRLSTLTTLLWRDFIRSIGGTAQEISCGVEEATELATLAEELGMSELALHGWGLKAVMERQAGRLSEAQSAVAHLQRIAVRGATPAAALAASARFAVAIAADIAQPAPLLPAADSPDPLAILAAVLVIAELALAGRTDEMIERANRLETFGFEGPLRDVGDLYYAISLVLGGHSDEAMPWIRRALDAAEELDARGPARAATALVAELTGDLSAIDGVPSSSVSLGDALALRARAVHGDSEARTALLEMSDDLAMPGLLAGIG